MREGSAEPFTASTSIQKKFICRKSCLQKNFVPLRSPQELTMASCSAIHRCEFWEPSTGVSTGSLPQSRPDVAVQTSLSQQAFPNPCIRNLRDANNAVRRVKQNKDLEIWFRAIHPTDLTICRHSDAAWANVGSHTQAGYVISFVSKSLNEGKVSPRTAAVWKSYKMSRAVNSTLSGGSQALATANATVE